MVLSAAEMEEILFHLSNISFHLSRSYFSPRMGLFKAACLPIRIDPNLFCCCYAANYKTYITQPFWKQFSRENYANLREINLLLWHSFHSNQFLSIFDFLFHFHNFTYSFLLTSTNFYSNTFTYFYPFLLIKLHCITCSDTWILVLTSWIPASK